MVLFNYATKEITAKIVYYGPGLCGKTTNLQFIYDSLPSNSRSKMLSLATKTDRTLFFDFLPLDIGKIRGMRTKLQLYTVPGQVYYNSTRQLVLKGADGVVFVADSQDFALDANLESFQNLEDNLKRQGIRIAEIPLVMQYNKRDLPNALPVPQLESTLNKRLQVPSFESVATTGLGVEQTLKGIAQLVLSHLIRKYGLEGSEPLEKEIQILNPNLPPDPGEDTESLWSDEPAAARSKPAAAAVVVETSAAEDLPLVETELITPVPLSTSPPSPFDDLIERFESATHPATSSSAPAEDPFDSIEPTPVPMSSIETAAPAPVARATQPQPPARAAEPPASERRASDGLVKEITLPLNLSLEELKRHKKLKLKITLDVNLLP
jgi:signal recognition particle receptor subunit beta